MKKFLSYKTRSVWKGFFFKTDLMNSLSNRNSVISKKDIGKEVYIYNGCVFYKFNLTVKYIGYKLSQFVLTKKLGMSNHLRKKKKKKKKINKKVKN